MGIGAINLVRTALASASNASANQLNAVSSMPRKPGVESQVFTASRGFPGA